MFKISICIPTYNRENYLPELLDSIIAQAKSARESIEICISNNASEDNTEQVVKQYLTRYPHIKYHKFAKNMGADRNYLKVVEIATGKYCWLMGSDDVLQKDALSKVLKVLPEECEIILGERVSCNKDLIPYQYGHWLPQVKQKTIYNLKNDTDFMRYISAASSLGALFSYISSIIFLREQWNKVECDERMYGSAYAHVYMLLNFNQARLLYLPEFLVLCRHGNDSFFTKDLAKRSLLDMVGYELIAKLLFFDDIIRYRGLLLLLQKELGLELRLKGLLCKRFFSTDSSYKFWKGYYAQLYGNRFRFKFVVVDVINALPLAKYCFLKLAKIIAHYFSSSNIIGQMYEKNDKPK